MQQNIMGEKKQYAKVFRKVAGLKRIVKALLKDRFTPMYRELEMAQKSLERFSDLMVKAMIKQLNGVEDAQKKLRAKNKKIQAEKL